MYRLDLAAHLQARQVSREEHVPARGTLADQVVEGHRDVVVEHQVVCEAKTVGRFGQEARRERDGAVLRSSGHFCEQTRAEVRVERRNRVHRGVSLVQTRGVCAKLGAMDTSWCVTVSGGAACRAAVAAVQAISSRVCFRVVAGGDAVDVLGADDDFGCCVATRLAVESHAVPGVDLSFTMECLPVLAKLEGAEARTAVVFRAYPRGVSIEVLPRPGPPARITAARDGWECTFQLDAAALRASAAQADRVQIGGVRAKVGPTELRAQAAFPSSYVEAALACLAAPVCRAGLGEAGPLLLEYDVGATRVRYLIAAA